MRIGRYLEQHSPQTSDPLIKEILESIDASINSCGHALDVLNKMGKPLADDTGRSWFRRVRYVWDSDLRHDQEKILDRHVNFMTLDWVMLLRLDDSHVPQAVLPFSQSLCQDAQQLRDVVDRRVGYMEIPDDADEQEDLVLPSSDDEEKLDLYQLPAYLDESGAALFVAVACQEADQVKRLLDAGCDPNLKDEHERTLFHRTCQNLDKGSLTYLLAAHDRFLENFLDAVDDRGDTALMLVSKQANQTIALSMARELLSIGGNPSFVNETSETHRDALYNAMDAPRDGNRREFSRMLANEFGADVSLVTEAFPRTTKQYLGRERTASQSDATAEGEDEPAPEPLERRSSLLDRVIRRLSNA